MSTLVLHETVYLKDQLPHKDEPQIALAGRSNVGKSSLVNALAGSSRARRAEDAPGKPAQGKPTPKKPAKVSVTPGKTRSLNFYAAEPEGFYVVDLPGYGYASCSREEQAKWGKLINHYLEGEKNLKAMVLLLDCRLSPQESDIGMAAFAASLRLPLIPVLTKTDKCTQKERAARQQDWAELLDGQRPLLTSAATNLGVTQLWTMLRRAACPEQG